MRILELDDDIHSPEYYALKEEKLELYTLEKLLVEIAKPHKEEYEIKKYCILDSESKEEDEAFEMITNFRNKDFSNKKNAFNILWEKSKELGWY